MWENGQLVRSLGLSPDFGIQEDIGAPLPFEQPYWRGDYPALEPAEEEESYPFPFRPLELANAAMVEFFGYELEGMANSPLLDAYQIPALRFKRTTASE